uniref:Putative secreted protein n=1 Tax=Lutzomyia longipalpis TaxID=7200 RepID=A0A7G3AP45_LUTLO
MLCIFHKVYRPHWITMVKSFLFFLQSKCTVFGRIAESATAAFYDCDTLQSLSDLINFRVLDPLCWVVSFLSKYA